MQIIEQCLIAKSPRQKSEDGIVITDDFIAVIDGSTSKSTYRHSLLHSNGRYAMLLVSRYIRRMPKKTTLEAFLRGVTAYVHRHYRRRMLPQLSEHPEDRLAASAAIFSRVNREIWLIGDCHCLANGIYYDNPKPDEGQLAARRAEEVRRLLREGISQDELLRNDTARPTIIPAMIESMKQQNVSYAVIDGFPIPRQHVRMVTLDFQPWEIAMATDGYPFLCASLEESEALLQRQRKEDPLNIGTFQATKAFHPDNNSFDDRTYVRFRV